MDSDQWPQIIDELCFLLGDLAYQCVGGHGPLLYLLEPIRPSWRPVCVGSSGSGPSPFAPRKRRRSDTYFLSYPSRGQVRVRGKGDGVYNREVDGHFDRLCKAGKKIFMAKKKSASRSESDAAPGADAAAHSGKRRDKAAVTSQATLFEPSLAQLEQIVRQLEQGNLTLAQSLDAYQKGVELLKVCYGGLQEAEQRIRVLTGVDASGQVSVEDFNAADSLTRSEGTGPRASHQSRSSVRKETPVASDEATEADEVESQDDDWDDDEEDEGEEDDDEEDDEDDQSRLF